jgi:hypothetical protein
MDADAPELILASDSAVVNLRDSSCSSMITRTYSFLISTNDYRIKERLHPVEWMLFVSLANWPTELMTLEWEGKRFVTMANITGATTGLSNTVLNRGIKGWSAIWSLLVQMHFATADLAAEYEGAGSSSGAELVGAFGGGFGGGFDV